jgi:hypothetical protein
VSGNETLPHPNKLRYLVIFPSAFNPLIFADKFLLECNIFLRYIFSKLCVKIGRIRHELKKRAIATIIRTLLNWIYGT